MTLGSRREHTQRKPSESRLIPEARFLSPGPGLLPPAPLLGEGPAGQRRLSREAGPAELQTGPEPLQSRWEPKPRLRRGRRCECYI